MHTSSALVVDFESAFEQNSGSHFVEFVKFVLGAATWIKFKSLVVCCRSSIPKAGRGILESCNAEVIKYSKYRELSSYIPEQSVVVSRSPVFLQLVVNNGVLVLKPSRFGIIRIDRKYIYSTYGRLDSDAALLLFSSLPDRDFKGVPEPLIKRRALQFAQGIRKECPCHRFWAREAGKKRLNDTKLSCIVESNNEKQFDFLKFSLIASKRWPNFAFLAERATKKQSNT